MHAGFALFNINKVTREKTKKIFSKNKIFRRAYILSKLEVWIIIKKNKSFDTIVREKDSMQMSPEMSKRNYARFRRLNIQYMKQNLNKSGFDGFQQF